MQEFFKKVEFFNKVEFEKNQQTTKEHAKFPYGNVLTLYSIVTSFDSFEISYIFENIMEMKHLLHFP